MTRKKTHYLETERLEMFCDGVFAIAITLLILEIKIPTHQDLHEAGGLYHYLTKLWPSYISYVVSFLSIGIYWSNHHWMFSFVKKTNHIFNLLNVVALMMVAFMPFSTAILGEYIMDPEYRNAAATIYCIGYLLPIPAYTIVVLYAFYNRRLVDSRLSQKFMNKSIIKLISGMVLTFMSVVLSFHYPWVSISMIGATMIAYLLPPDTPEYDDELASNPIENK